MSTYCSSESVNIVTDPISGLENLNSDLDVLELPNAFFNPADMPEIASPILAFDADGFYYYTDQSGVTYTRRFDADLNFTELDNNDDIVTWNQIISSDDYMLITNNLRLQDVILNSTTRIYTELKIVNNRVLNNLQLNSLVYTSLRCTISGNWLLHTISLPQLADAGHFITIDYKAFGIPESGTVQNYAGDIMISGNLLLNNLSLPALKNVGSMYVRNQNNLVTVNLPSLTTIYCMITVNNNFDLTTVSMNAVGEIGNYLNPPTYRNQIAALAKRNPTTYWLYHSAYGGIVLRENQNLTTLNCTSLQQIVGDLVIQDCPSVTSINMPNLLRITRNLVIDNGWAGGIYTAPSIELGINDGTYALMCKFQFSNNPNTLFLNCSTITDPHELIIENNDLLELINFGGASRFYRLSIKNNPKYKTLQSAALTEIIYLGYQDDGVFSTGLYIEDCEDLSYIRFLSLTTVEGYLTVKNCYGLSEIKFPVLTNVRYDIDISNDDFISTTVTDIDLQSLVSFSGNLKISRWNNLESVTLPSFTPYNDRTYDFKYCKLSSAFINWFLAQCVSVADFVSGTIDFRFCSFGPSGQGILDKATLIARGVNVMTL